MRLVPLESKLLRLIALAPLLGLLALIFVHIWNDLPEPKLKSVFPSLAEELGRGSILLLLLGIGWLALWNWSLHEECKKLEKQLENPSQKLRDEFVIDHEGRYAAHPGPLREEHIFCPRCLLAEPPRISILVQDPTDKQLWNCLHQECKDLPPASTKNT